MDYSTRFNGINDTQKYVIVFIPNIYRNLY